MALTQQQALDRNRRAKAEKVYLGLIDGGILPRHIKQFGPAQWEMAAQISGYRDGHISPECRGLVLALCDRPPGLSVRGFSGAAA